ncbi:MAG TPA: amino acid aminotransferase [Burkholderiales bacterium]|nr:amino acid aminotransferase [Burkholderiales bacterium]
MTASILAAVQMAPRDPILGITEAFNADPSPSKVNLGVGVYYDDNGRIPVLECVRRAERQLLENSPPRGYLPIDGLPEYDRAVQALVLGGDSPVIKDKRAVTVQALGGTGALKVGADFLQRADPGAQVWISQPSWENHRALFENAGFAVEAYPYYDAATHGLDFDGMLRALRALPPRSVVVLHACCHNPTGVDLTPAQWTHVIEAVLARELVPFLDIAYQGFADGIDADAGVVRRFVEAGMPVFVSNSFSKSFSLYGERIGALTVVAQSSEEAARVLSQLKRMVRTNYSNPPTYGGKIVANVLASPELRTLWEQELQQMRNRIREMRLQLVEKVQARAHGFDFGFVTRQRGMFSYSGLSKQAVARLRDEFSIYAVDTGRICVAALNSHNIDYVANAIAQVAR